MNYLSCDSISIPLTLVQAITWAKTAKTVQSTGGYITARGFEPVELSARIVLNNAVCTAFGLSFPEMYALVESLQPNRLSGAGVMRIAGFAVYPEMQFALTNVHKTVVADYAGGVSGIECDIVFSGVSCTKEVVRSRALQMDPLATIPRVKIIVDGKELSLQDGFAIAELVTMPDGLRMSVECGSDMDVVSREGFLEKIIDGGVVRVELPTGTTDFHVATAFLVGEELTIEGSIYPAQSQAVLSKTYVDADLSEIVSDLAELAGISCECKAKGKIDYYRANQTPLQCLRELQESAGFVISCRIGKITCAFLPQEVVPVYDLEYLSMDDDGDKEPILGVWWYDGINLHTHGKIDTNALRISACFRAEHDFSENCLALARYRQHRIRVTTPINPRIDSHSVVSVVSNDTQIACLVEWFACDWIRNEMEIELNYL